MVYIYKHSICSSWMETRGNKHKGPFTNTCRGAWCKKKLSQNFPPPSDLKNFSPPPPPPPVFWPWKLRVNPIEKRVNSIFTGKFMVIFFKAPHKGQKFKGPLFASGPPNRCFGTAPKPIWTGIYKLNTYVSARVASSKPSWSHTTAASLIPQPLSHTVPQTPLWKISTRPS